MPPVLPVKTPLLPTALTDATVLRVNTPPLPTTTRALLDSMPAGGVSVDDVIISADVSSDGVVAVVVSVAGAFSSFVAPFLVAA